MIVIVGGGVAGAAAAAHLARAGRRVLVLEREAAPAHKVCGEFISVGAQALLSDLEIPLDDAAPVERVRLHSRERCVETVLPFRGVSLSRRVLDERLLARAEALGAVVRRGAAAKALAPGGVRLRGGEIVKAQTVLLATGKHDLRGAARPHGRMLGLKMHFETVPESLDRTVELRLFDGGYAGLEPVEGGNVNLCLVIERDRFPGWNLLLARIGLDRMRPCWSRPLSVAGIPYGYLHRGGGPAYRLGDQFAVIPSFAGDGITIALHSARRVVASLLAGEDPAAAHARLAGDVAPQLRRASILASMMRHPRAALALASLAPAMVGHAARATRLRV